MAKSAKKLNHTDYGKTRKQLRKEKRLFKKIKRNEYYLNKSKIKSLNSFDNSKCSLTDSNIVSKKENVNRIKESSLIDEQMKRKHKENIKLKKLERDMKAERKRQLEEANKKEDKMIKDLEKKLKLNRRKSKALPKSFIAEGLDYLLEVCDYEKYKDSINLEKELNDAGDEFGEDLATVIITKKAKNKKLKSHTEDLDMNIHNDGESNTSRASEDDFTLCSEEENEEFDDFSNSEMNSSDTESENETKVQKVFEIKSSENKIRNVSDKKDTVTRMKKLTEFIAAEKEKKNINDSKDSKFECKSKRMKALQDFVNGKTSNFSNSKDGSDEDIEGNVTNTMEQQKVELREDIYGRLRDKDGNIVQEASTKYIPPQLRTQLSEDPFCEKSKELQRLRKQMKGLLNRVTEHNMHSIAKQMEDLYMQYSRNDVNRTFITLLMDSLVTSVMSPERIIIEHAMLISILHANIGTEIGAHILQLLVEELDKLLKEHLEVEDKRIDNIVILLCQLYNFKIFHSCLIYDLLKRLVDSFQEKDIELILIVLKNIGFVLRKDDPASLKELIYSVQKKANESSELRENARIRFMLDTLSAVKNNNMLKISNYDPSYVEHLKKIQKSLLRPGKYVTELKISMEDLLHADTRGRWWIVGSAWKGDSDKNCVSSDKTEDTSFSHSFDQKILNLAKKQRMNTDSRKNIFCILMSSEDYVDAFEKLMKLGLKGQQYQEIIYVLIHCLMKEKRYNPYYAFVAEQFCSVDRKYQLAVQFSTWDKFKEINSFNNQQITNLAKFLSYLFVEQKLPISILKVLQFTEMNKRMVRLIRQIMLAILLDENEKVVIDVFSRISKSEKLFMLREGLQLFLHHFVLKNIKDTIPEESEAKLKILPKRVELAINVMRDSDINF